MSLLQNSLGSGIYCREELLSLGARASRPHKTWQGRGDWLHRVGRFTRPLALEQRLDKYAGGTPALPGGNPWLARCRSLSRALFCRSILPPSHARLRILQKARVTSFFICLRRRRAGCMSHPFLDAHPPPPATHRRTLWLVHLHDTRENGLVPPLTRLLPSPGKKSRYLLNFARASNIHDPQNLAHLSTLFRLKKSSEP